MTTGGVDSGESVFRLDLTGLTLLDRYRVLSVLGKGGMATVYRAQDIRLSRTVVVKVPDPAFLAEEGFVERFQQEIRSLTTLEHPHIVKALDTGEVRGVPYAVLQYLGGGSLESWMKEKGRLSPADTLEWLPFVADALDFVHKQNVVHRDVKPGNILRDEAGHFFLADFGIAKTLAATSVRHVTKTGMLPGSPEYMAPEAVGDAQLTPAYDQYALALTAYQALAGRLPFESSNPLQALVEKSLKKVRPIREMVPDLPIAAAGAIMRALQKEPEKRHASCTEFAQAFVSGLGIAEPSASHPMPGGGSGFTGRAVAVSGVAPPPGTPPGAPPGTGPVTAPPFAPSRRRKVLVLLLAALLVFAGGAAAWWFLLRHADSRPSDPVVRAHDLRYKAMTHRGARNLDAAYDAALEAVAAEDDSEGRELRDSIAASISRRLASAMVVSEPLENAVVGSARFEVVGTVPDPSLRIDKVLVDGQAATLSAGVFRATVEAKEDGPMKFEIVVAERHGLTAKKTVRVVVDTKDPLVEVASPAEGALLNGRVTVSGHASDAHLETVTVNGTQALLSPGRPDGRREFTVTIDVPAGEKPFDVRIEVTDRAGHTGVAVRHTRVDTVPPKIEIASPAAGSTTSGESVEVKGTVDDPAATVTVDGAKAAVGAGGAFSSTVPLRDFGPKEIVVRAKDAAGNEATTEVAVTREPAHAIEVLSPEEGSWVATRHVDVSAKVSGPTPTDVRFNGQPATLSGDRWTAAVEIADGDAQVEVQAVEPGGEVLRLVRRFHVDSTALVVRITTPSGDDKTTSKTEAVVRGSTGKPGCGVTVGGVAADVSSKGEFTATVPLTLEGENWIAVVAHDRAGNEAKADVVFVRDTTAPVLTVAEPGDGAALPVGELTARGTVTDVGKCLVAVRVDGVLRGRWESSGPARSGAPWEVKVTMVAGSHVVSVQAWDGLRNTGPTSTVDRHVTVGAGTTPPTGDVAVPNLVGRTLAEAKALLAAAGLLSDPVMVTNKNVPAGQVFSQKTAAGTKVARGSPVVFRVATP